MQVGELCARLDISYRHGRYVLEQGIMPKGVDEAPTRGHHRQLSPGQAFWLGIVLKLKDSGVQAPLAGQIADYAREALQTITQSLGWEPTFEPFGGHFDTRQRWFVDVGDLRYIRLVTDANPSRRGRLDEFAWFPLGNGRTVDARPVVIMRLDIVRLAQLLRG